MELSLQSFSYLNSIDNIICLKVVLLYDSSIILYWLRLEVYSMCYKFDPENPDTTVTLNNPGNPGANDPYGYDEDDNDKDDDDGKDKNDD